MLPFKTLRERLQTLLDESHTPVDLTLWYTLPYRGESYSVHGVGQLQRYLDHDQRAIVLDPPPIVQRVSYAATVAEIVGHMFWWLLREQAVNVHKLDDLRNPLKKVLAPST